MGRLPQRGLRLRPCGSPLAATGHLYAIGWQLFLTSRRAEPLGGGELALIAARTALVAGAILTAALAPLTWLTIRVAGLSVVRIGYLLLGGAATTGPPIVLHYAATPGWAGMLRDWMRMLLGVRILHIATVAAALQQPVLATTVQQAILLLGSDVGGYCRSPLLSDPLTQRRLACLEGWLSTLLTGPLGLPLVGLSQESATAGSEQHATCVSVLTFLNITLASATAARHAGRAAISWAALSEQLRGLLPRFLLPADDPVSLDMADQLMDLGSEGGELPRLQASGLRPSPAEAEALRETLTMAAALLGALNTSMQGPVSDLATARRVNAVCQLFSTCFHLCFDGGVSGMIERFLPCATLLLRCGAAAQSLLAREVQRGSVEADQLIPALTAQLWALDGWQLAAYALTPPADADEAASAEVVSIVESCAPAKQLHQWLQCTLVSLRLVAPAAWKPGIPYAHILACFSGLLGRLCFFPPSDAHREILLKDEQLCSGPLQLLLPAISALAWAWFAW
ncbi:hypothetical protein C2E21_2006 [Chlorella sorokiniana]|uniref:Uncharacterized protein n=1 Tax=Chlorella sorokiniana TaxID=3076 RepID=A0A2P6U0P5_CHLSO|nr:hypothetical protein C2E21_2006 [Chlorella sorokiniana]|eukprot:PRW59886.1 hypothetical protein C2E21_2006 [Chlorella sorokiniana]